MLLYVVRHGVTEWNRQKRAQGCEDVPLAPEGLELARKTGEAMRDIHFDLCYTSPLSRAKETAKCILRDRNVPVIEDPRIREIDFGVLSGVPFTDAEGRVGPGMEYYFSDPLRFIRPENGENIYDLLERTKDFWEDITTDLALSDKSVLVSSHGCAVRALLQNIYCDPENFWHGCVPPNCCVNLVEVRDGKARLLEEDRVYA